MKHASAVTMQKDSVDISGDPSSSMNMGNGMTQDDKGAASEDNEHITNLEKQNKILTKAKESQFKKNQFQIVKLQKKIDNLTKENEKKQATIVEREKEIKL